MGAKTVKAPSQGVFKERHSEFLAYLFPIRKEEEISAHLRAIRKQHPGARHICYAYRYGDKEFYSDAKEPPILDVLKKRNLAYVLGVVVRYFGGTKLGLVRLKHAYATAMEEAITHAQIVDYEPIHTFTCYVPYASLPSFKQYLIVHAITILQEVYQEAGVQWTLEVPQSKKNDLILLIHQTPHAFLHEEER
jgi:putative IMPACT (imprinted ancient) family translation regulator